MPDFTDPWERSTGRTESVMNTSGKTCLTSSVHKAVLETLFPEDLKYYEDRRVGKIKGKAFEEWGDPLDDEEMKRLKEIEIRKVRCAFFPINYSHGFSGRGGKFSFSCLSLYRNTDEFVVLPESMERPCLVGPRNETVDEGVDSSRGSSHEQSDRPLWQASDEKSGPFGVSKDDIDAGSLGESRDGEEVGPFGESGNDESFSSPADSRDEKVSPLQELADDELVNTSPLKMKRHQAKRRLKMLTMSLLQRRNGRPHTASTPIVQTYLFLKWPYLTSRESKGPCTFPHHQAYPIGHGQTKKRKTCERTSKTTR